MALSVVSGGAAAFISIIGFSEYFSFLPMINLEYPMGLRFFFQGISGMNFQFYNAAGWLSFLDLPKTRNSFISDGFSDAGFDTISFFLGTADIVFVCLITFANYLVTRILLLVLGRFKYWNKKLTDKQQAFKGGV